jgi:hypothetical protein
MPKGGHFEEVRMRLTFKMPECRRKYAIRGRADAEDDNYMRKSPAKGKELVQELRQSRAGVEEQMQRLSDQESK